MSAVPKLAGATNPVGRQALVEDFARGEGANFVGAPVVGSGAASMGEERGGGKEDGEE